MQGVFLLGILFLSVASQLCGGHHKIQILMTVPRTVSTAFEKSMWARGDHKVFHEPWCATFLNNAGLLSEKPPEELVEAKNYEGVKALFYRYAETKPVFVKDMFFAVKNELLQDEALLSDPDVILTILIRDPALSIESFFLKMNEKKVPEHSEEDTRLVFCYDFLVQLAEKYRALRGVYPIIVEAEELCANPYSAMESFCQQAGISFMPEALAWEKGFLEEWQHIARWHTDAANSEAFFIPKRTVNGTRFSAVPEEYVPALEAVYQEQMPSYAKLKAMR